MSGEINVTASISVRKNSSTGVPLLDFQGRPGSFRGDMEGTIGPTPGALVVTEEGVDIDLSVIKNAGLNPGYGFVANYDDANYIRVGIWDGSKFYSMLKVGPGEQYPLRLDHDIGWPFGATGTGTLPGTGTYTLRAKSSSDDCNCFFGFFAE